MALPAASNLVFGLGRAGNIQTLTAAFKQGFVFELIDSENAEPLAVHVMVLNPIGYTLSEPHQVELTPGMGGGVVEESSGHVIREITLRGTYGRSPKTAEGYEGPSVNNKTASGTVHFAALRGLFRQYSALKKDAQMASRVRMVLHVLRDDDHFLVSPRTFETPLDEKARVHYPYILKLAVLGEDRGISSIRGRRPTFSNAVRDISEAFHDARAFFADATASIDDVKGTVSNVEAIFRQAAGAINAVGNFVSGATSMISYPLESFTRGIDAIADASDQLADAQDNVVYGSIQETARSFRKLEQALDRIAVYGDRFAERGRRRFATVERAFQGESRSRQVDTERARNGAPRNAGNPAANGGATIGTTTRAAAGGDQRGGGLTIPENSRLAEVLIRAGDTLDRIAAEHGTTPALLALINDLSAPYIVRGGGPGFANIGDRILVPVPGINDAEGRGGTLSDRAEELLYGTDIRVTVEGAGRKLRLGLAMSTTRRDVSLVRGVDNIVQGLTVATNTERGATQHLPQVGIRRNVGKRGTLQELLLSNVLIREAVLSDSRIEDIAKSRVTLNDDVLSQEITPIIRSVGPSSAVSLPIGTLPGS